MRYITTTSETVEKLRKRAAALQRKQGGKTADLLDKVARTAGYLHWRHVMDCFDPMPARLRALRNACREVIEAAEDGYDTQFVTTPDVTSVPLLLFAARRDAWLLLPGSTRALCLAWQGEAIPTALELIDNRVCIPWDTSYALMDAGLTVVSSLPQVGTLLIEDYPVQELMADLERASDIIDEMRGTGELGDDPDDIPGLFHGVRPED